MKGAVANRLSCGTAFSRRIAGHAATMNNRIELELHQATKRLWMAQQALVTHYSWTRLKFTLDGRLLGDIAESVALEHFDLVAPLKRTKGVDALVRHSGDSVQIKASGRMAGPAFTSGIGVAKYLLFFQLDMERGIARVAYNGLEAPVRSLLPPQPWKHTVVADLKQVLRLADTVPERDRLQLKKHAASKVA